MIKFKLTFFVVMVLFLGLICFVGCKKNETAEPSEPEIKLNLEYGTVTDIDGNVYKTVKIGNQWWMAENLKVTKDPSGKIIENFCYNNDESNADILGRLYSWDVAMNKSKTPGAQGIAPNGWHIPTAKDWDTLVSTLGGYSVAGGHLKATVGGFWLAPNTGATNMSGFTAIAAGEIDRGKHWQYGESAVFWSSNETDQDNAVYVYLDYDKKRITKTSFFKNVMKYSIRCIKN